MLAGAPMRTANSPLSRSRASWRRARTGSTIVLVVLALWVLMLLMKPIDRFDAMVLGAMVALTLLAFLTPLGQTFYELHWPGGRALFALGGYLAGVLLVASIVVRRAAGSAFVDRIVDRLRGAER